MPREINGDLIQTGTGKSAFAGAAAQVTVNLPYSKKHHWGIMVTDVSVTPASKIVVSIAGVPETAENSGDMLDIYAVRGVPGTGEFEFQCDCLTEIGGPLSIIYQIY